MIHYIIFHPENQRQSINVTGKFIGVNTTAPQIWKGTIWVDQLKNQGSNEDPFVFNKSWLYSYCHATQLCRNKNRDNTYLQEGSHIIFCNGDAANRGLLEMDTVFVVGTVHKWDLKSMDIPTSLILHKKIKL